MKGVAMTCDCEAVGRWEREGEDRHGAPVEGRSGG